ncbi:MAG TPA: hypothetical protein DEQ26_01850 [Flavobacteriaceae bacterium]|nr:hypothetical protein [Flavobacteriaceae bacterium]
MDNLNMYQGGDKSTFSINALTYMFETSYAADIASKGVSPAEISYFIHFHNINFGAINSAPL